jgi:alpha-L-fucosidase
MDYILLLTKHHDGFCLWDTDTTDWKVTNSPLGVDVVAEVRSACDRHGLELALYFSEGDWLWPDARDSARKKAQLEELLSSYGDVAFWWMDHAAAAFVRSIETCC